MESASAGSDVSRRSNTETANPAKADRRLYRRYAIAIPAKLEAGGQFHDCAMTDLSLGGVALEPALNCQRGDNCRLHCEDFYFDGGMAGIVVNINDHACHIEFKLDQDMEAALTMFLVMSPATR